MFSIQDKRRACQIFSPFWSLLLISLCQRLPFTLTHFWISSFYPLLLLFPIVHSHLIYHYALKQEFPPPIAVWGSTELSSSNPAAQHHAGLEKKKKQLSAVTMGKIWPHPNHSGLQCDVCDCWLNVSYPVTPNSFEGMEDAWQFSLCSQFSIWQLSSLFWICINSHFWRVRTVKHVKENTSNLWTNFCLGSILQRMQQRHLVKWYEKLLLLGERNR